MLERPLNYNIRWLKHTCTICRNVEHINFGMMNFYPLFKFFANVHIPLIYALYHLLICWKCLELDLYNQLKFKNHLYKLFARF